MGLIRKTLAVGSVGVVKGSSKKQRNAAAALTQQMKLNAANGIAPRSRVQNFLGNSTEAERKAARAARKVYNPNGGLPPAQPSVYVQQPIIQYIAPHPAPQPVRQPTNVVKSPDGAWYLGPNGQWIAMPDNLFWDGFTWKALPPLPGTPQSLPGTPPALGPGRSPE